MAQRRIAIAAADDAPRRDPRGALARPGARRDDERGGGGSDGDGAAGALRREQERARKRREAEARQKRSVKLGPLEKTVAQLEDRIAALEAEQKVRSAELSDPAVYDEAARRNKLLSDYQAASDKLEELTARWEAAMAALEAAKAELGDTG
jgi:ATP-binding cassette subfamily F protein 3